ncbi:MAG: response regulator [Acidobacteria bacterium]|nr:response regulator [Acidobacteriota bacterium]
MKALIIDDEDDVRQVVRLSLGRVGGMDVADASSGDAGISLAAATNPDFILLDLMMPEMDGVETLCRLREDPRTSSIPVIFLTAKALPSEIERLRKLGALDVVVKPFNPMTLADQLRSILGVSG